jgi:succinate-acetate transporter protein
MELLEMLHRQAEKTEKKRPVLIWRMLWTVWTVQVWYCTLTYEH